MAAKRLAEAGLYRLAGQSDLVEVGAIDVLQEPNPVVPDDVSVICFDVSRYVNTSRHV